MRKKQKKHPKPDKGQSEMAELFALLRNEAQTARAERRAQGYELILQLEEKGYNVEQLTEYQFRVNGAIDLYPTNRKFHDLRNNSRGYYGDPLTFIQKRLAQ